MICTPVRRGVSLACTATCLIALAWRQLHRILVAAYSDSLANGQQSVGLRRTTLRQPRTQVLSLLTVLVQKYKYDAAARLCRSVVLFVSMLNMCVALLAELTTIGALFRDFVGGGKCTCFTSKKVQILTLALLVQKYT